MEICKLPRLPLEIWLLILKIKRWTDRRKFIKQFYKNIERNIVFLNPKKLFSEEEEEFFTGASGYIQSYYFKSNFTTHHYCTLTYPTNTQSRSLFELRILRREGEPRNYYQSNRSSEYYYHNFKNHQVSTNTWISVGHPFKTIFYFNKVG